jgi:hypothetical protein
MGKHKKRLVLAIIFDIVGVGLMTWEPYIFADLIDDVLMPQRFERLLPMLGKALLVGLAFAACPLSYERFGRAGGRNRLNAP